MALEPLVEGEMDRRHAADAQPALYSVSPCNRGVVVHWPFPLPTPAPPPVVPLVPVPPPPPPLRPPPPVGCVEVLPGLAGVVAGGVLGVVVGVVAVLAVGVLVTVLAVVAAVLAVVGVVAGLWHWTWASWLTVETPWVRSLRSVLLTVAGRFSICPRSAEPALAAAGQLLAWTAEETWSRPLLMRPA